MPAGLIFCRLLNAWPDGLEYPCYNLQRYVLLFQTKMWRKHTFIGRILLKRTGCTARRVLPSKRLLGMCRWMGSHFLNWTYYNGVAFLVELSHPHLFFMFLIDLVRKSRVGRSAKKKKKKCWPELSKTRN